MKLLVVNVGSTSFKYKLFEMNREEIIARGRIERIGSPLSTSFHEIHGERQISEEISARDHARAVERTLEVLADPDSGAISSLNMLDAIGFKTVHAGRIVEPKLITEGLLQAMAVYSPVAPAHNPNYIAVIESFHTLLPETPLVAVFESGYHITMPDYATIYSVPYEWYEKYDVRRYGFHGASFKYLAQRIPKLIETPAEGLKIVACHLGGSSSVCAIKDSISLDTSMGFSPQSGLPMGTRCGEIDPFLIPFVAEREGLEISEVIEILSKKSGLLGISGIGADMRDLESAAAGGNDRAQLAIEAYAYQVKKFIGAYAAVLGGLDILVFTGGIGENAVGVRQRICASLDYLGIKLDLEKNRVCAGQEMEISKSGAPVKVLVIPANEELIVARETQRVLSGAAQTRKTY